jgi:hypothetical protein
MINDWDRLPCVVREEFFTSKMNLPHGKLKLRSRPAETH